LSPEKKLKKYKALLQIDKEPSKKQQADEKPMYSAVKRFMDLCIVLIALTILSPILLLEAIAIKLTSEGPVFYIQERVGKNGKAFMLYKFRTMIVDAEKHSGPVWSTENDMRVTFIGKILRRTRLDEFPQLLNVLKGDMSIVGPRPERPYFVAKHVELQGDRLSVKPGITGLAQVEGTYHFKPNEKWFFDEFYIHHKSIALDLIIMSKTLWVMVSKRGS